MKGLGIDIIEIARFKKIRYLSRFLEFVFLPEEMRELEERKDKFAYISSRFAAKEAVVKAMPVPVDVKQFQIIKKGVKPEVSFLDQKFDDFKIFLSLSHSEEYVAAVAVVE
jgi:holo-[acyl-carrier protein] synthase